MGPGARANSSVLDAIGCHGRDTFLAWQSYTSGFLGIYTFTQDRTGLELLHKTKLDDVPFAIMAFQGQLMVGVGKALRIYEMGKKKLLWKVENKASF